MLEKKISSYCLMTQSIGDLGGSQLYTLRRLRHLVKNNIKVCIVAGSADNFHLKEEFSEFDILIVPEINYLPFVFPKYKWESAVKKIVDFLHEGQWDIIENHSLATAVYGELVSKQTFSKNIIYLLNEDKVKKKDGENFTRFFNFKLHRKELYGVSSKSLEIILDRKISKDNNNFINILFDLEEISENHEEPIVQEIQSHNADFKILSIARLDKAYLVNLIEDTVEIAKEYSNLQILLIIIGNSSDSTIITNLKKMDPNLKNLKIIFPGYLHPIPSNLFTIIDIFIGQGTASVNSISQGCATAIIDPRDNKSPGFFGIDTNNFGYPEKDLPNRRIKEILQEVLVGENILKEAQERGKELFYNAYLSSNVMNDFDYKILKSDNNKIYWSFRFRRSKRRMIEFLLINILGIKLFEKFFNKMVKFKKK